MNAPCEPSAPAARPSWTRSARAHVLLLCLVTLAHWLPRLRGPIDLRYDSGVYYVLGTALAEGKGYRLLNEPGDIEAIQYPPLLAAWVALHQLALGTSDPLVVGQALRISSVLLSLLYAGAAYALARRWLEPRMAFFAALIAVLYFHVLYLEDLLFAELPFALLALGFFLANGAGTVRRRAWTWPLAAAAFCMRTAGLALFAAWSLEALLARRWRAGALRALFGAAVVLAWQGHVWRVRSSEAYAHPAYAYQRAPYQFYNVSYAENVALIDPFQPELGRVTPGVLAQRLWTNAPHLLGHLGEGVSAPRGFWEWPFRSLLDSSVTRELSKPPVLLLGALVLAGLLLLVRAGERALPLFVLCSLGLVALLPWPKQFPRYLAPLAPPCALALVVALAAVGRRWRLAALTAGAAVLGVQLFALWKTFTVYHHRLDYPRADAEPVHGSLFLYDEAPEWRAFHDALWWLRANAPRGSVVATSCPHLVWIHTGLEAVMPPLEADVARAEEYLDSASVDFLVLDELKFVDVCRRYAQPVLERSPERWELAYRHPSGKVTIQRRKR